MYFYFCYFFCLKGAGHGIASILLMLLNFPICYSGKPDVEDLIKQSVDYILQFEDQNGNYPPVPGEERDDWNELVHWCHGGPGIAYLFAKAYLVWKDEKYLQAILQCGDLIWKKGLLKKGPGICHGISGLFVCFHNHLFYKKRRVRQKKDPLREI